MELNKGIVNSANASAGPCCSDGYVPVHHGQRDVTRQEVFIISLWPVTRFARSPHHSVLTSLIYCISSHNWFHQTFISEKNLPRKKKVPGKTFLRSNIQTVLHQLNHAHCLKKKKKKKKLQIYRQRPMSKPSSLPLLLKSVFGTHGSTH